jgi:C_GCAxxG_C_C family probable redox protein
MKEGDVVGQVKARARGLFVEKRSNCAEAVFKAVQEWVPSILPQEVSSLMTPFGGGVGIRGANCGALLAGVASLGLVYGRSNPDQGSLAEHRSSLWQTYSLFNQLPHIFEERFGTIECWELTRPYIYGSKRCRERCEEIVAETAGMVVSLLEEARENGLSFPWRRNLLEQAVVFTGLSVLELITFKVRGEPFPIPSEAP